MSKLEKAENLLNNVINRCNEIKTNEGFLYSLIFFADCVDTNYKYFINLTFERLLQIIQWETPKTNKDVIVVNQYNSKTWVTTTRQLNYLFFYPKDYIKSYPCLELENVKEFRELHDI